jgi:hypothetical protein
VPSARRRMAGVQVSARSELLELLEGESDVIARVVLEAAIAIVEGNPVRAAIIAERGARAVAADLAIRAPKRMPVRK